VVYSPNGRTLAAGSHQLLADLPAGATVTDVCLSNSEARRLCVSIDGTITGVPSVVASPQSSVQAIYDLSGRRLDNDWNELPQGIYVIRVNGKQIKVKK
jgi:hypothetical protein